MPGSSASSGAVAAVFLAGVRLAAAFFAGALRAAAFLAGTSVVAGSSVGAAAASAGAAVPAGGTSGGAAAFLAGAFRVRRVTTGVAACGAGVSPSGPVPVSVRSGWSESSMWCSSGTVAVPIRRPPLSVWRSRGRKASVAATPSAYASPKAVCHLPRSPGHLGVAVTDSSGRVAVPVTSTRPGCLPLG